MKESSLLLIVVLCVSCSTSKKSASPAEVQLSEAMKRESSAPMLQHLVISEDNLISYSSKAKTPPVIKLFDEKVSYHYTSIDIGSQVPVECFIYSSQVNPALTLKSFSANALANEQIKGGVKERSITFFGSGAIGNSPYLILNTSYKTGEENVGYLKSMIGIRQQGAVVCLHNEVGYNQTFIQRFAEVITTLSFSQMPEVKPLYSDIMLLMMENFPMGFVTNHVFEGKDKNKTWISRSSLLFPNPKMEVTTYDNTEFEITNEKGKLIQGRYNLENDLKESHSLEINQIKGKEYHVKGFHNHKYISSKVSTDGILSRLKHTMMVPQKLFKEGLRHFSIPIYTPEENVFAPVQLRTSVKEINPNGAIVRIETKDVISTAVVDKEGMIEEISVPAGPSKITGKRIYKEGSLDKK
ncbi:MAG: hypothetical protein ACLGHN_08475 [Bacteriovoracia bacterium]